MDLTNVLSGSSHPQQDSWAENNEKQAIGSILDYQFVTLTSNERLAFSVATLILLVLAVLGNTATFFTNLKRKLRPFFRACLMSLACSDMVTTIFISMTYLTQFSTEFIQIWHLGELLCGLIPFFTTAAILVNSMTLVGIALDRYMAIIKIMKGHWEPGGLFCGTCMILIWGLAAGIASPMISSYGAFDLVILITDPSNSTILLETVLVQICGTNKDDNAYYYIILFTIVFVPALISFVWLNSVIAKEVWRRRQTSKKNCNLTKKPKEQTKPKQKATNTEKSRSKRASEVNHKATRENRQLRMFCIILVLMSVFLVCRLPTWVYLIMKLNGDFLEHIHWIIHFSLGLLSLGSCVLNPILYTFLTETIQYTLGMTRRVRNWCRVWKLCTRDVRTPVDYKSPAGHPSNGEIYTIFRDK